jgi:AraC family ethanolamine operon transcriptional activator
MSRFVFRDFDEFADSITGVAGRFVPTARSSAEWWVEQQQAGRLALQQIQVGSAVTFAGDGQRDMFTLGVPMSDVKNIRVDGHPLNENSYILLRQNQPFTCTGYDVTRWAGITLPVDHPCLDAQLFEAANSMDGPRTRTEIVHLARLRALIGRVCSAENVNLDDPAAAASAEQELALAIVHALEASRWDRDRHVGRPQFSRRRVIARALELIEANEGQPLFVEDLCRAAQVSERTLRNIFQEYFGVGPMRLLKVRQLREIRAALLTAHPRHDTVTQVAARFGIWDFSLFARNYKALFGESPSTTLRSSRGRSDGSAGLSWLRYAAKIFVEDAPRGSADTRAESSHSARQDLLK